MMKLPNVKEFFGHEFRPESVRLSDLEIPFTKEDVKAVSAKTDALTRREQEIHHFYKWWNKLPYILYKTL